MGAGNDAWVLIAAALVLFMTPGLALFYGGMVRSKNVLATMMLSFACMGAVTVLWRWWRSAWRSGPTWATG
ncbi:MAG: hypothetical protein ACYCV5_03395 [Acidimicrobiales bacterium]